MSSKKVQPETAVQSENKENNTIRLSAMELSALSFFVSINYEKASQQEKACEASFEPSIIAALVEKGLLEQSGNTTKATPFGVKWCLQSTTFGYKFGELVNGLTNSALHMLFFTVATELKKRHEQHPIYYLDKDGNKSRFWQQFLEAVDSCEYCLESAPVVEEEQLEVKD